MSKKTDHRFPLRLDDLTRWKIESWYQRDDCGSRNEFVVKAVNFYADYLAGLENGILPVAIQSAIDGRLGMFEDRMARLLYKVAVEMDMGMNAVLDCRENLNSYGEDKSHHLEVWTRYPESVPYTGNNVSAWPTGITEEKTDT